MLITVLVRKSTNGQERQSSYAGIGIAMAILVESTVRVTIRAQRYRTERQRGRDGMGQSG